MFLCEYVFTADDTNPCRRCSCSERAICLFFQFLPEKSHKSNFDFLVKLSHCYYCPVRKQPQCLVVFSLYFLYKSPTDYTVTVALGFFWLSRGRHVMSASLVSWLFFPLSLHIVLCTFGCLFFGGLSHLPLSVLISRRSPAHCILFALGQDKHCLCVTPKTFHRLSRFQYAPNISVIGFFLLWESFRESENGKKGKKRGGGKRNGE